MTDLEPDAYFVERIYNQGNIKATILKREFTYVPAHERGEVEALFSESTIADTIHNLTEKTGSPRCEICNQGAHCSCEQALEKLKEEFKQEGDSSE